MWGRRKLNINRKINFISRGCMLTLLCVILLSGCTKEVKNTKVEEENEKILVGFSMGTLMEDRWLRDRDIFMSMAKKEGMEVIFNNANKNSDLQYKQVLEMIDLNIDVLVIAPNNSNTEARCVKAAKDKGIPVISYDRLIFDSNVDAYISFDNEYIGNTMGRYVLGKVPKGNYMLVNGSVDDSNSQMISAGYMGVLGRSIDNGNIKILSETNINGWIREDARIFVANQLGIMKIKEEKVDVIICGNDSLARGVIEALSEAQVANDVIVIGQDADLVACQYLVSGKQSMTIYKPIANLVARTVEACVQLAKGEKIIGAYQYNDGTYEVPFIKVDAIQVTKENLDETVIKDGFHLKSDVYGTLE